MDSSDSEVVADAGRHNEVENTVFNEGENEHENLADTIEMESHNDNDTLQVENAQKESQENPQMDIQEPCHVVDETPNQETVKGRGRGRVKGKAKEDEELQSLEFPKSFTLQMISETLQELRLVRKTTPPLIPPCRIVLNQAVRIVSKEAKSLRETLLVEGYVREKGSFILSITTTVGSHCPVTDEIVNTWDAYWKEENACFESELQQNEDWKDLSGKMFLCWDGNHRTDAWMQEIKDRYSLVRSMHFSVQATFVHIDPQKEAALIRAMSRINELNEAGIVHTKLKDVLYGVYRMTLSNLSSFVEHIPLAELQRLRAQEVKAMGLEPWYPHTRYILVRILYQSQIDTEIEEATSAYADKLNLDEAKANAEKEVKTKWVKKMAKYLAILNPDLGGNWVNLVTSNPSNTYMRLTVEKLYVMTRAKVDETIRDRWFLWMTSSTAIVHSYKIPNNDKDFHEWVKKETWLEHLIRKSQETLESVLMDDGIVLKNGPKDITRWFREFKLKYRNEMLKSYDKNMSMTVKQEDAFEIRRASQRVCFRYLKFSLVQQYLDDMPILVSSWATNTGSEAMYSEKGNLDRPGGLTNWEISNCPWWIDFPQGVIPEEEKEMHKEMLSSIAGISSGSEDDDPIPEKKRRRKNKKGSEEKHHEKLEKEKEDEVLIATENSSSDDSDGHEAIKSSFSIKKAAYANVSLTLVADNITDIANSIHMKGDTSFKKIRDVGRQVAMSGRVYSRGGVKRNWGADIVLLDFPTNEMPSIGHSTLPSWNVCTPQLVADAFTLATLCVDDEGVVVCLCLADQLSMVEGQARKFSLERRRLYCMTSNDPYGVSKDSMGHMTIKWCYLVLYGRIGTDLGYYNTELFSTKDLNKKSSLLHHALSHNDKFTLHDTTYSRFGLERSTRFMEFLLHCFCAKGGFVLDLFAGTGSMMEACALWGYHYYGMDIDEGLIDVVLSSRGCMKKDEQHIQVTKEDENDDMEVEQVEEPSD